MNEQKLRELIRQGLHNADKILREMSKEERDYMPCSEWDIVESSVLKELEAALAASEPGQLREEQVAAICHLAWCCYQLGAGQKYNEQPTEAQLESQRNGFKAFSENPTMTAEGNHDNWMKYRLSQGWKYGAVKDEQKKTHPDLIPFNELPTVERNKDVMDLLARRTIYALLRSQPAKETK